MAQVKFIILRRRPSGCRIGPHSHGCYELVYYFGGRGRMTYVQDGEKSFSIEDHKYVVIEPEIVHSERYKNYEDESGKGALIMAIGFTLDGETPLPTCEIPDAGKETQTVVNAIQREFTEKKPFYEQMINNLFGQLYVRLLRASGRQGGTGGIGYAKAYIDEYYTQEIDLNELARTVSYSVDHFRCKFKAETGLAPKAYILKKRIEHAKASIAGTSLPITQIAENSGFGDYVFFSRVFKRETGMTPSSYREKTLSINAEPFSGPYVQYENK